ncbi:MAG: amidohydrolase family protein [Candidatus Dormiibacterota bacterium]
MSVALAIRAKRIFDGERMLGAGMVLVEHGRISAVDVSGATPPAHAQLIDCGDNATLLPGLIDCHVHLGLDATPNALAYLVTSDDATVMEQMRRAAATALRAGITTMRDLGDRSYLTLQLRDRHPDGTLLPEIVAAGVPITTPGGHFAALGGAAAGPEALRAAVRERADRGCQVVKVMASGGNLTPGSLPHESQFGLDELRLIVVEAHRQGLATAAHAHGKAAIIDAFEAGFDTLEHVTFFTAEGVDSDPAVIERIAQRGTFVSLTVGNVPGAPAPPPGVAQRLPQMLENARRLCSSGARIVPGPDGGATPGKPHNVLPYALQALVDLGMRPVDALRAATVVAAGACGVADRKGRIAAGSDADLLAVTGNPLADIAAIRSVVLVIRGGHIAVDETGAREQAMPGSSPP